MSCRYRKCIIMTFNPILQISFIQTFCSVYMVTSHAVVWNQLHLSGCYTRGHPFPPALLCWLILRTCGESKNASVCWIPPKTQKILRPPVEVYSLNANKPFAGSQESGLWNWHIGSSEIEEIQCSSKAISTGLGNKPQGSPIRRPCTPKATMHFRKPASHWTDTLQSTHITRLYLVVGCNGQLEADANCF